MKVTVGFETLVPYPQTCRTLRPNLREKTSSSLKKISRPQSTPQPQLLAGNAVPGLRSLELSLQDKAALRRRNNGRRARQF
jgi:hypothetical protein